LFASQRLGDFAGQRSSPAEEIAPEMSTAIDLAELRDQIMRWSTAANFWGWRHARAFLVDAPRRVNRLLLE